MTDVLEETTGATPEREQVLARIDDWERRIADLYRLIEGWLPAGWTATADRRIRMDAEMMREAGVPVRWLPALDLAANGRIAATIEPRGLWIIGANGRLDLRHGKARYMLIDVAQNFQTPDWQIVPTLDRTCRRPLDAALLRSILSRQP